MEPQTLNQTDQIASSLGLTNQPDNSNTSSTDQIAESLGLTGTDNSITKTHVVQPGETLSGISQQTGTPIDQISGYKSGNPDKIQAGETINLPSPNKSGLGEISTHTAERGAYLAGADPKQLVWAKSQLGKKEYQGYCQSFVMKATNGGWQGSSAIDAWQRNQNKVAGTLQGIKQGDLIYFTPNKSNDGYGHVGIFSGVDKDGNGKFISATDNGVAEYNFKNWNKITKQKILGYISQGGENATQ